MRTMYDTVMDGVVVESYDATWGADIDKARIYEERERFLLLANTDDAGFERDDLIECVRQGTMLLCRATRMIDDVPVHWEYALNAYDSYGVNYMDGSVIWIELDSYTINPDPQEFDEVKQEKYELDWRRRHEREIDKFQGEMDVRLWDALSIPEEMAALAAAAIHEDVVWV